MHRWPIACAFAIILAGSIPDAHGMIIITPKQGQVITGRAVELVEQTVDVKLTDRAAEVSVECTYFNSTDWVLEGTWLFPLPPEAAVDKFSMMVGGEEIEAELLDASVARQIYEDIVRQTRDPALLEYVDRQLLRARIFPIEPHKEAGVKLYYTHPLIADFGVTDFVFPILDETWSVHFWNDPQRRAKSHITVEINTNEPLKSVTVPTHEAEITHDTEHHATVRCAPEILRQAGDLHLLCTFDTRDLAAQFLTTKNDDGSFFMAIIAPGNGEGMEVLAKDVVFCFDRSGSMQGEKIRQAREALRFCLNSLNPNDRFGLILFNDALDLFRATLSTADGPSISEALKRVEAIEAEGGTFIHGALERSLGLFEPGDRPRYLVFLTDGLPTVGITAPDAILTMVRDKNVQNARLFTFGVGYDLNAGFLNDLADQNTGYSSYVAPEEDVEVAVSNFFRKLARPVLADCDLTFDGEALAIDMYPSPLPDVFAGNEIIVLGRFTGQGEMDAHLKGLRGSDRVNHTFTTSFTPQKGQYPFVAKLWAGRRIGHLLDEMRRSGETAEVKDEIVRLSKTYGIMTPYTSFLAAPEEVRIAGGVQNYLSAPDVSQMIIRGTIRYSEMPVPADRSIEASKLKSYGTVAPLQAGGRNDLVGSISGHEQDRADVAVSGRRFTVIDGIWTDWNSLDSASTITDTIAVKPFSEAYFRLAKNPEIAAILALGDRITFLWRNTLIKIDESGAATWNNEWTRRL